MALEEGAGYVAPKKPEPPKTPEPWVQPRGVEEGWGPSPRPAPSPMPLWQPPPMQGPPTPQPGQQGWIPQYPSLAGMPPAYEPQREGPMPGIEMEVPEVEPYAPLAPPGPTEVTRMRLYDLVDMPAMVYETLMGRPATSYKTGARSYIDTLLADPRKEPWQVAGALIYGAVWRWGAELMYQLPKVPERLWWTNAQTGAWAHLSFGGPGGAGHSPYESALLMDLTGAEPPEMILEAAEKFEATTQEEILTRLREGEIGYTFVRHPERLQPFRDDVAAGMSVAEGVGKYEDFWLEMGLNTLIDPAWFIPAKAMNVIWPGGVVVGRAVGAVAGAVAGPAVKEIGEEIGLLGKYAGAAKDWLMTFTKRSQVTMASNQATDAIAEVVLRAPDGEDILEAVSRALSDDFADMTGLGPTTRRGLADINEALAEKGIAGFEGLVLPHMPTAFTEAWAEDLIQPHLRKNPMLIPWLVGQAVEKETALTVGYVPPASRRGLSRSLAFAQGLMKEQWLGINPAYMLSNMTDNTTKCWATGHYINPFDLAAPDKVASYMGDYGAATPSRVVESMVASEIGEGIYSKTRQIALPGIGKPAETVDWWSKQLRADLRTVYPWLDTVAPRRPADVLLAMNLAEPPSRLARFVDNMNYASLSEAGRTFSSRVEQSARSQLFFDVFSRQMEEEARPALLKAAVGLPDDIVALLGCPGRVRSPADITNLIELVGDDIPLNRLSAMVPEGADPAAVGYIARTLDSLQDDAVAKGDLEGLARNVDDLFDTLGEQARRTTEAGEVEEVLTKWKAYQVRQGIKTTLGRGREVSDLLLQQVREKVAADPRLAGSLYPRYFDSKARIGDEVWQDVSRMVKTRSPNMSEAVDGLLGRMASPDDIAKGLNYDDWGMFGEKLAGLRDGVDEAQELAWKAFTDGDLTPERLHGLKVAYDEVTKIWQETAGEAATWRRGYIEGKGVSAERYETIMNEIWEGGFKRAREQWGGAQEGLGEVVAGKVTWLKPLVEARTGPVKGTKMRAVPTTGSVEDLAVGVFLPGEERLALSADEALGHSYALKHLAGEVDEAAEKVLRPVTILRSEGQDIFISPYWEQGSSTRTLLEDVRGALKGLLDAGTPGDTGVVAGKSGVPGDVFQGTLQSVHDEIDTILRPLDSADKLRAYRQSRALSPELVAEFREMQKTDPAAARDWFLAQREQAKLRLQQDAQAEFVEDLGTQYSERMGESGQNMMRWLDEWRLAIGSQIKDGIKTRAVQQGEREALQASLGELSQKWANSIDEASVAGSLETGRILFDYSRTQNWEGCLSHIFPFTKWQLRNPFTWAQILSKSPGTFSLLTRYVRASEEWRKRENLSSRFKGMMPIPGQEMMKKAGILEEGTHAIDPSALFSVASQLGTPFLSPEEEAMRAEGKPWQRWLGEAIRAPERLGIHAWPWIQQAGAAAGAVESPSWGVTGAAGRVFPGVREAEEEAQRFLLPGGSQDMQWLTDYWTQQTLAAWVAEGKISAQEAAAPSPELLAQAEQTASASAQGRSLARWAQPFGLKYARPGEMDIRNLKEELRDMPEERAAYLRSQHPEIAAYGRAVTGVSEPEMAQWRAQRDEINLRYDEMTKGIPPWHPRNKEVQDLRREELEGLPEQPEGEPYEGPEDIMRRLEQDRPRPQDFSGEEGVDWGEYDKALDAYDKVVAGEGIDPKEYEAYRRRYLSPLELAWELQQERLSEGWEEYGRLKGLRTPKDLLPQFGKDRGPDFTEAPTEIRAWVGGEIQRRLQEGWSPEDVMSWAGKQTQLPYDEIQRLLGEEYGPRPVSEYMPDIMEERPWLEEGARPEVEEGFTPRPYWMRNIGTAIEQIERSRETHRDMGYGEEHDTKIIGYYDEIMVVLQELQAGWDVPRREIQHALDLVKENVGADIPYAEEGAEDAPAFRGALGGYGEIQDLLEQALSPDRAEGLVRSTTEMRDQQYAEEWLGQQGQEVPPGMTPLEYADQLQGRTTDLEGWGEEWGGIEQWLDTEMPGFGAWGGKQDEATQLEAQVRDWYYDLLPQQAREARDEMGLEEGMSLGEWQDTSDLPPEEAERLFAMIQPVDEATRLQAELDLVRFDAGRGEWTDLLTTYYTDPDAPKTMFWSEVTRLPLSEEAYDNPQLQMFLDTDLRGRMAYSDEQWQAALDYLEENKDTLVDQEAMALAEANPEWFDLAQEERAEAKGAELPEEISEEYWALTTKAERSEWKKANPGMWKELSGAWNKGNERRIRNPHYLYIYKHDKYEQWFGDTPPDELKPKTELKAFQEAQAEMDAYAAGDGEWSEGMDRWFGSDSPSSRFWNYYHENKPFTRVGKDPLIGFLFSKEERDAMPFDLVDWLYEQALMRLEDWTPPPMEEWRRKPKKEEAPAPPPAPSGGGGGGGVPPPPPPPPAPWLGQSSNRWMT